MRVGESELHRLELEVIRLERITAVSSEIEPIENIQRDERGQTLAIRWDLPNVVTPVAGPYRLDPGACVAGEIGKRQMSAGFGGERGRLLGKITTIEIVAARRGDPAQRRRVIRQPPDIANPGRVSIHGEG